MRKYEIKETPQGWLVNGVQFRHLWTALQWIENDYERTKK